MFKKLLTALIACSIFTVQAYASSGEGLKSAFDELNYSLSVEWNQTDKTFYTEQMQKFTKTVRELQVDGLTSEEIIAFAKSQVKDQKVAKDLETAFSMIAINKMNSEEASKYMIETMKKSYNMGVSFRGGVVGLLATVGLLFIVSAVIVASAAYVPFSTGPYCNERWVCQKACYYDPYYGYTCYDDCYWACY